VKDIQKVLIIYNPKAMKGRVQEFLPSIKQRLSLRFAQVDDVCAPSADGNEDLARKNAEKYDIIVSLGGDGTLHQIVSGVAKSGADCKIGVLPFGTCNDVARTLGVPRNLDGAIDCILRLNSTKYDVMYDGDGYAVYSLATGYLTQTSYAASTKSKKRFGRLAYVFLGIKLAFRYIGIPMTVTCDGERIHDKFSYFMLMNGESVGGFKLNKGEVLNNNKVKVVMVKKKGLGSLFAFVKLFMFGINSVKKSKYVIVRDANDILIENHSNEPFTLDGEKATFLKKRIQVNNAISFITK